MVVWRCANVSPGWDDGKFGLGLSPWGMLGGETVSLTLSSVKGRVDLNKKFWHSGQSRLGYVTVQE